MTDRLNGVWVAFDKDIRVDDAEPIIAAIKQLRGVIAVEGNIREPSDWLNETRVRNELGEKLFAVLYPKKENK